MPSRRYVLLDAAAASGEPPVPSGTRSCRSAFTSSNRELLGALGSADGAEVEEADLSAGAGRRHPTNVTRSARFGGSGCAVPGVGLPVTGLPPPCADAIAVSARIAAP